MLSAAEPGAMARCQLWASSSSSQHVRAWDIFVLYWGSLGIMTKKMETTI